MIALILNKPAPEHIIGDPFNKGGATLFGPWTLRLNNWTGHLRTFLFTDSRAAGE